MKIGWPHSVALAVVLGFAGSVQASANDAPTVVSAPDAASDEAGLLMIASDRENRIKTSPFLVRDLSLNDYVRGVVCKIGGPHCTSMRVYIMRIPYFNAFAMPNGALVIWSGLLLRLENEAQLAMLLGHEMTHYSDKHGLKNFRNARDTGNRMAFYGLPIGGPNSPIIRSITAGMIMRYSRDQEREADAGGLELASAAGYDPNQAAAIWKYMAIENKVDPSRPGPSIYDNDHPSDEERLATLARSGSEIAVTRPHWTTGTEVYRAKMAPFRSEWLEDEIARGNGYESATMLERLAGAEPSSGLLAYYLGEAYRRRNQDGDVARAQSAYRRAISWTDAPAAAWRELGLMAMKSGDAKTARLDFTTYLSRAPKADDRAMIDLYISQLGGT